MSRIKSLLWKEWHEVRVLLAIALFVFVGLPAIGATESPLHRFYASPWVFVLGGLLAALVGVGTVTRDLNGKLDQFWRAGPFRLGQWLAVKFLVGLGVVLAALAIPLIVEIVSNRGGSVAEPDPRLILAWSPFLWAAAYGVAFAVACLVRRPAHAAVISVALLLALCCLPYVLPPAQFLQLSQVMEASEVPRTDDAGFVLPIYRRVPWMPWRVLYEPRQLPFVAGMVALCAAGLALAVPTVKRDWRIESGHKLIYWSIGVVVLIGLSSAALQVGTNLPLLQKLDLPKNSRVYSIQSNGSQGVMVRSTDGTVGVVIQPFSVNSTRVELDRAVTIKDDLFGYGDLWVPTYPKVLYVLGQGSQSSGRRYPMLSAIDMSGPQARVTTQAFPDDQSEEWSPWRLYPWKDRLYLLGLSCRTFDLSQPTKPRLLSTEQPHWPPTWLTQSELELLYDGVGAKGTISLPAIPGIPPRPRLELLFARIGVNFTGEILTRAQPDRLTTYHLDQLTDSAATFRMLGRYEPAPLELLYGNELSASSQANDLLFEATGPSSLYGSHLTVFGLDGPHPRPIGHFASPTPGGFQFYCALPDGRLLLTDEHHLYFLGPPPRK